MTKHLLALAAAAMTAGSASSMYIVGAPAGDWSPSVGIEMTEVEGGWKWSGNVKADDYFAFATQLEPSNDWNSFNSNYRLNPPADGTLAETGEYTLTLGGKDCAFRGVGANCTFFVSNVDGVYNLIVTVDGEVTPVDPVDETQLALRGTMNDWGFGEEYYFSKTDEEGVFTFSIAELPAGSEFKIANSNWSVEYTSWDTAMQPGNEYNVGSGGGNMGVTETFKNVNFVLNTVTNTLSFTESAALPEPDPDWQIVEEQPEGELTLYSRDSQALREFMGSVEKIIDEGSVVKVVEQADGTVWIGNPISMFLCPGWIKAEKDGDYLTIKGPQLVYEEYDWDADDGSYLKYYITAVERYEYENEEGVMMVSYRPTTDGVFKFKINGTTIKEDGTGELILGICAYDYANGYFFTGYGDQYIVMSVPSDKMVEVPETAEIYKDWAMTYYGQYDEEKAQLVDVAIDGDDYYFKGIYKPLPDSWVKGTKTGDCITFKNFQPFGADLDWNYFVYLAGGEMRALDDDMEMDDAVLDENGFTLTLNEDGIFEADNTLIIVTSPKTNPENANYVGYYMNVEIKEQDPSAFTNPVGPDILYLADYGVPCVEFNLPNKDENGNLLNEDNLYFSIYTNSKIFTFTPEQYSDLLDLGIDTATTELPYNVGNGYDFFQEGSWHSIYIYSDEELYNVGVQAIYYPEGRDVNPDNVLTSELIMVGEKDPGSVDGISLGKEVKKVTFYNMNGQVVSNPEAGIYIRRIEFADGTVKTMKMTRK